MGDSRETLCLHNNCAATPIIALLVTHPAFFRLIEDNPLDQVALAF
jgi:hypothetical protein